MKGFGGILILFTVLIISIILLSSTYQLKNEENNSIFIPKMKNFITIYEFNLKNMSYDCNWQKDQGTLQTCLQTGTDLIFDKTQFDLMISCTKTPIQNINSTTYYTNITCINKALLQKNTTFNTQKRILLTAPQP